LHNRAIVFDAEGREVFRYNKLHPYRMSEAELGRYGLPHVFNGVARTEDITTLPLWAGVADTPMGRIAVVICEDLANIDFYLPVVKTLAIDWLLVPVLDGAQIDGRWTARKAAAYAEYGTSIVVVTSRSLVEAHRRFEASQGRTVPAPGVALIARLGGEMHLLDATGTHDRPVFRSLTSTKV
jgi:predicted amidohydrolase